MNSLIGYYFFFFAFYAFPKVMTLCPQGSYLNMCDFNACSSEGNGWDADKQCTCDYQQVYCSIIEVSFKCNLSSITLSQLCATNLTDINHLSCDIKPLESQANVPVLEISNITGDEVEAKILWKSCLGKYKILCKLDTTNSNYEAINGSDIEILNVSPSKVFTDTEVELILEIQDHEINHTDVWCLIISPDDDREILLGSWSSENHVKCLGLVPKVPGVFYVGVMFAENFSYNINRDITLQVFAKAPLAQEAEYSFDFQTILIYFNENIELHSDCVSVFSKDSEESFGLSFTCTTRGNILIVKLGTDFKYTNMIEILPGNKIYRAGPQSIEYSQPALSATLPLSDKKVLNPNLSFYIMNTACNASMRDEYLSMKVTSAGTQHPVNSYAKPQGRSSRKSQRENLIIWRNIRQLQKKLNNLQINSTEMLPSFQNLANLENLLGDGRSIAPTNSNEVFPVVIQSSPSPSAISAEVSVAFCHNFTKLYRYKWSLNDKIISEDGKILVLKDLSPGKFTISCSILDYDSAEVLGQGWAVSEIPDQPERVVLFPTDIVANTEDVITIYAITWGRKSILWSCRTDIGNPCFTTAPQKLLSDVINLNSSVLSIPAGTLPAGSYLWIVEGFRGANTARVVVKTGNFPRVHIEMSYKFVSSTSAVTLNGVVRGVKKGCRIWWSTVREKGFDYFKLHTVNAEIEMEVMEEDTVDKNISLVIPAPSGEWKGLKPQSSYLFKLQTICCDTASITYVKVPINVNDPPQISPLLIEPLTGDAMITSFRISGAEASDSIDDYPLLYEWSYVDPCDVEIPIGRGVFPKNFTTYLPPGDVRLIVRVCDVREACSVSSTPLVTVTQPSDIPPENFNNVLNQMRQLMVAGDTLEAFWIILTALKSIVLTAETEIRWKIFSAAEEVIQIRVDDLKRRSRRDPKLLNLSLKFYEQAIPSLKFFPKNSSILRLLTEFKDGILKIMNSTRVERKADFFEGNRLNDL